MNVKLSKFMLSWILVVLIAVIALTGCNGNDTNGGYDRPATEAAEQTIGQGETVFRFEVTNPDETITVWDVSTDAETVGAALVAVGLIAGDESEWGLMVTQVNGITADFDADGAFWAFFIDGEFAMTGVDDTPIEAGVTYAFVYTQG